MRQDESRLDVDKTRLPRQRGTQELPMKMIQGLLQRIEVGQRLQGFVEGDGHWTLHPRQIRHGHLARWGKLRSSMVR